MNGGDEEKGRQRGKGGKAENDGPLRTIHTHTRARVQGKTHNTPREPGPARRPAHARARAASGYEPQNILPQPARGKTRVRVPPRARALSCVVENCLLCARPPGPKGHARVCVMSSSFGCAVPLDQRKTKDLPSSLWLLFTTQQQQHLWCSVFLPFAHIHVNRPVSLMHHTLYNASCILSTLHLPLNAGSMTKHCSQAHSPTAPENLPAQTFGSTLPPTDPSTRPTPTAGR